MARKSATEFIEEKRNHERHAADDLRWFVLGYSRGDIPDYQASAWLMAVCLNGLDDDETFALTDAMVESGATLDLGALSGLKLDKHSTGGVGDKVTLAVVPILASAGILVPKMSGRGLGFTGGTIDKLESIPGFRVDLSPAEIVEITARTGACVCAQTDDLVPADRKMYALRDVTGTVESLPLIAASIMSKKIAAGADAILLDVKVGRGAFMKTLEQARALAGLLSRIGAAHGRRVSATLTAMDIPLGRAVGNWLEVEEAADLLRGRPSDIRLMDEVVHIAGKGLSIAGKGDEARARGLIESGAAFAKLIEMVAAQGGDIRVFDAPPDAARTTIIAAERAGWIADIDALAIGRAAMHLGAGRPRKGDPVDPLAGIVIEAPVGSRVDIGEALALLQWSDSRDTSGIAQSVQAAFRISDEPPPPADLILGEVESRE